MKGELEVFAINRGTLFVKARYVGLPLAVVVMFLGFTKFKGRKTPYVRIQRAIEFHRKEVKDFGCRKSREWLDAMEQAIHKTDSITATLLRDALDAGLIVTMHEGVTDGE